MAMTKAAKGAMKIDVAKRLKNANATIVAEYRGLTVSELTELRVKLRDSKSEFRVVKNRIARVAIREDVPGIAVIEKSLKGPIGLVIVYGDPAVAAKALIEFSKDKEKFKVTIGVMEGRGVTAADLKAISELPTKDVLLTRLVCALVGPHRNLLGVLTAVQRNLVQVLNAIKETKASDEPKATDAAKAADEPKATEEPQATVETTETKAE